MIEDSMINYLPWYAFFTIAAFLWGACFGSYLNVCIYRIPLEMSTNNPRRSFCPSCKKTIPWYCNIPLLSYLFLGGKCKFCGTRISIRYFLVEGLTALLFVLVWLKFDIDAGPRIVGLDPITNVLLVPVYWLMVFGLILGTFVDFEHLIIPDRVTLGGIAAGLVLSLLVPDMQGQPTMLKGLMWSAVGASVGWLVLWAIAIFGSFIFKKEAMGFGDVKLLGAIGAFLGWKAVVFNILISSLAGSIVGIIFVLTGKKEMGSRIPYGPYIALAAVLWILWGPAWWDAYVQMLVPATPHITPVIQF